MSQSHMTSQADAVTGDRDELDPRKNRHPRLIPAPIMLLFVLLVIESIAAALLTAQYGSGRTPPVLWYQAIAGIWVVGLPSLFAAWRGVIQIRKDAMKTLTAVFGGMAVHFAGLVLGCLALVLLLNYDAKAVFLPGLIAFATCLVIASSAFRTALREAPEIVRGPTRGGNRGQSMVEGSHHAGDNGPSLRANAASQQNPVRHTEVTS